MRELKQQLDLFIRKYYVNQMIRGTLWTLIFIVSVGLLLILLEYYLYLPYWLKLPVVVIYIAISLGLFIRGILIPLLKSLGWIKRMTYQEAAWLIGEYYQEIQDKLFNLLEIEEEFEISDRHPLIEATVAQRTKEMNVFSFPKVVNLKANRKYIKWILPSIFILCVLMLLAPQILKDTGYRWVNAQQSFDPPAPFKFVINEKGLKVARYSDFLLDVRLEGGTWTENIDLVIGGKKIPMEALKEDWFQYKWSKVEDEQKFYIQAGRYKSPEFTLSVFDRAQALSMAMYLEYPTYTQIPSQTLQGWTDVQVPEGTRIYWTLNTVHVQEVLWTWKEEPSKLLNPKEGHLYEWDQKVLKEAEYQVLLKNHQDQEGMQLNFEIKVIQDEFPSIQLERMKHETDERQLVLTGIAMDDYGITALNLVYEIQEEDGQKVMTQKVSIPYKPHQRNVYFEQYIDLLSWNLKVGQRAQYFIEVIDNDMINGPKTSMSEIFVFEMPRIDQIDERIQTHGQQAQQGIKESIENAQKMNETFEQAKIDLLQSQGNQWDQQQSLRDLMNQQQEMFQELQKTQQELNQQMEHQALKNEEDPFKEQKESLAQQLEDLKNQELQEQLKKLQDLLQEQNKSKALEAIQQIQEQNKMFQMDMERIQSLIERLTMQQDLNKMAEEMMQLAEQQEKLAQEVSKDAPAQDHIKEQFEQLKKLWDEELFPRNNQMKKPLALESLDENTKDLAQTLQELQDKLQHNNNVQKSKEEQSDQKDAAQQMKDLAEQIQKQSSGLDLQQISMDLKTVRQLLSNLIRYSFEQEELMEIERSTPVASPEFPKFAQKQMELNRNAQMMRDSLTSLSQRIPELSAGVQRATHQWVARNQEAVQALTQRAVQKARIEQRFAMGHANDMAIMLEEMMNNLMQQMNEASEGNEGEEGNPAEGQGGKPGEGLEDIITGQEELGANMPGEKGQDGSSEGSQGEEGSGNGQKQQGAEGDQSGGDAEQVAKWVHEQQQLRAKVKALENKRRGQGQGNSELVKLLKEIQQAMNQQEEDMLFGRENAQRRIHHQQEIMQKLLEADQAIREQDQGEERRADRPKILVERQMPKELEEFLKKQQQKFNLDLPTLIPLKKDYKELTERYLRNIH